VINLPVVTAIPIDILDFLKNRIEEFNSVKEKKISVGKIPQEEAEVRS
jgi:hypothetical protein